MRLAYIGEPAVPYLVEGLEEMNARTRGSCAYVLGLLKDRRTIGPLQPLLEDPVKEVRYEAAVALGNMGDRGGYQALVRGLTDDDIKNRYKAHEALALLTGLDFGYRHDDAPEVRRVAVLRWEEWVDRMDADIR
jgi:HEAT repeat protein